MRMPFFIPNITIKLKPLMIMLGSGMKSCIMKTLMKLLSISKLEEDLNRSIHHQKRNCIKTLIQIGFHGNLKHLIRETILMATSSCL